MSAIEIAMRCDVAGVGAKTELPIKRMSRAAMKRDTLGIAADASVDKIADALDDASIKAQESMLSFALLNVEFTFVYH
ncbi:MAG: hypothetical protein ACREQC_14930 [Candidatus Binataceae bacterium]